MFNKGFAALLLVFQPLAFPQSEVRPDSLQTHFSVKDFGIVYPLSSDWVRATDLVRNRIEADAAPHSFDVLLAAVYVPKDEISEINPSFSLVAYRQPATDCKKNLEAMLAQSQKGDKKNRFEGGIQEFSSAGRDYFLVNMAHGFGGRHDSIICTIAKEHLLVWNAGALNEKGMAKIIDTFSLISALPDPQISKTAQSTEKKADEPELQDPISVPRKVKVSAAITQGLCIKKESPSYPPVSQGSAHSGHGRIPGGNQQRGRYSRP